MWCKDITECLITEGDRLEAMKGAEQMCVQVWKCFLFVLSIMYFGALWTEETKDRGSEKGREGLEGMNKLSFFYFFFQNCHWLGFLMNFLIVSWFCKLCCVFFFLESKQACSFGSWRASKTNQKHSVCFDHYWCACQGYSHRNGGASGDEKKNSY